MSTIGALLGMMITGQPFGIVMSGIGVIALAGVVVNNNIVLIDTYDTLRHEGMDKLEAILQTCRERSRPVVLTAATAILGVLPIAFGINLEILSTTRRRLARRRRSGGLRCPVAIVFGLAFSTVLTLIVTPSALMVFTRATPGDGVINRVKRLFRRRPKAAAEPQAMPAAAE
jgi:multidrug efflux pump